MILVPMTNSFSVGLILAISFLLVIQSLGKTRRNNCFQIKITADISRLMKGCALSTGTGEPIRLNLYKKSVVRMTLCRHDLSCLPLI